MVGGEEPRTNRMFAQVILAREFAFGLDVDLGGNLRVHGGGGGSSFPIASRYAISAMTSSSLKCPEKLGMMLSYPAEISFAGCKIESRKY